MSDRPVLFRWSLWLPLLLFMTFVLVATVQLLRPAEREIESAMIGKPVPVFDLRPATEDRPGLSSADLRDGKPKLLNIFASWCVPCIAEAPNLAELERQGAPIVGVAIRDRPEEVAAFLARNGNPYLRIGADDLSEVQLGIGSSGVPETFIVDGAGIIRYQHIGDIREEHIPLLLAKLEEAAS